MSEKEIIEKKTFMAQYIFQDVFMSSESATETTKLNGYLFGGPDGSKSVLTTGYLSLKSIRDIEYVDAITVAGLCMNPQSYDAMTEFIQTIGENVAQYIVNGEVNGKNYVVSSLAITDGLTAREILDITAYLISEGYYVGSGSEIKNQWVKLR